MFAIPAQAQTTSEFGHQLHPEKLLENTEGILQIFVTSNEMMVPKQIENLQVISSDNSIIEILYVEKNNDEFTKNIIIKAKKPGIAGIVLAASGFSSKEISLEVFNNNNYPTQILMKITPETFPIDGPGYGHVAIELATTGGLPTLAAEDTIIHLDTPNKDTIKLKNLDVLIPKGEYYVTTEFEITGFGNAIIFAETDGMAKISSKVEMLEPDGPLVLQLYAFPQNYNSYSGTRGFAIVQLLDSGGIPVIAEEDIHIKLNVENPDNSRNSSHDFKEVLFDKEEIVIEKGSYSDFTQFTPRSGLGDATVEYQEEYTMFISAQDYLTTSINIWHDQEGAIEGEGPSFTNVLPFLTTGKQEIIAVTHYETEIEASRQTGGSELGSTNREDYDVIVPVKAKEDHSVIFSSSELDTVNPIHPIMKKGENAVIVFGETGTVAPESTMSFSITDNVGVKTVTANAIGPLKDDISLIVEPLIPMILAGKQFPVLAYLVEAEIEEEGGEAATTGEEEEIDPRLGVTSFIEDAVLTFSANEFIEADYVTIKQNQPYALTNMISKELGTTTLAYQVSGFEGSVPIVSHTTDPSEIYVSFPKNILANSKTLATVQLLDSGGNPVYAKSDIEIKLVSNDEQVLQIPQELTIKNGEYFTSFDLETIYEGEIELALLSEDFSLSKYDINVVDISPEISLNLLGGMNWNERIEAELKVSIPEIQTALNGFHVEWEAEGGEVVSIETLTNTLGIATLNIVANDQDKVSITAKISGNGISPQTISKTVDILNIPITTENLEEATIIEPSIGLPIDISTMILIIIPVAIGGTLFFLKRTDRLDLITERIPIGEKLDIGDKIEGIKEKISDIRNR